MRRANTVVQFIACSDSGANVSNDDSVQLIAVFAFILHTPTSIPTAHIAAGRRPRLEMVGL